MIIKEIIIDGFGIFNGFGIKKLGKGINIISGQNEAGKSTLLKFIRYTLFGYPRFKEQRMMPLRGGNHGGRIKALMSSGEEILLNRNGNDQLTFYSGSISSQDRNQWFDMLGNANDNLFGNIYAFSIDELIGMGSFSESGMEDRLFSLGSGLGNISIGEISGSLQEKIDSIYSTRGKNQKIPAILKRIEDKKKELSPLQNNIARYKELQEKLISLNIDASMLETETTKALQEKTKLENYLKCYGSFIEISGIDEEMNGLPTILDYPEGGLEKLSELENQEETLEKKIGDLLQGNGEEKGTDELEAEEKNLVFREKLTERKDDVEFLTNNLGLYNQTLSDKEEISAKINKLNEYIGRTLKSINQSWTEKDVADLNEVLIHKEKIRTFIKEFESISKTRFELETLVKSSGRKNHILNYNNLVVLVCIILLIASFPFLIYGLFIAGAACIISSVILFFSKKYIIQKNPGDHYEDDLNKLENKALSLKNSYKKFLDEKLHLDSGLTPEAVQDILVLVEDLKNKISEKESLNESLENKGQFTENFDRIVLTFGDLLKFDSPQAIQRARQIINEYSADKEISATKSRLSKELESKRKKLARAKDELKLKKDSILEILKTIGARDKEDFKAKYKLNHRINELTAAKRKAIATISTIAGIEKCTEVIEYLKDNSRESINQRLVEAGKDLEQKNSKLKYISVEIGSITQEIKQVENNAVMAELLTGIESEKERLGIEYNNWLANKIALRVLSDVRGRYEKEKQPEVIKNAGRHFKDITGEKFTRITSSMDNKTITVFDVNETGIKLDQLSRGTREQLLLSLRLGIIEEYEKHSEPLPLVVDEIFVNFDPSRTKKTAEIFTDFAKDRQVIIFTCHPDTAGYFKQSDINLINLDADSRAD